MSKFFKALEQADRDRAAREQALHPPPATVNPAPSGVSVERAPAPATSPPPEPAPAVPTVPGSFTTRVADPGVVPLAPRTRTTPPRARERAGSPSGLDEHLVSLVAPTGFESDQYRALRHVVEHLHKTTDLSVLAVSSAGDGDGKTTTAINLAGALAQASGARILLVDADLRRSALHLRLGLNHPSAPGLCDAIAHPQLSLQDVVRSCSPFNFAVLPSGTSTATPYETLKSDRFAALLEEARRHYEYVIVDTPPLVPLPDCRAIEKRVDGFVLVIGADRTPRKMVDEALNVLDPARVVGIVFNGDKASALRYYYGYGHRNGAGPSRWHRVVRRLTGRPRTRPGG
jgi:protein-tyrosine kinase